MVAIMGGGGGPSLPAELKLEQTYLSALCLVQLQITWGHPPPRTYKNRMGNTYATLPHIQDPRGVAMLMPRGYSLLRKGFTYCNIGWLIRPHSYW